MVDYSGISEVDEAEPELFAALTDHTRKVADIVSYGVPGIANKMYHHFILTQKLMMSNRKTSDWSPSANYIKNYFAVLPRED